MKNFEKYKTAEERVLGFGKFCRKKDGCKNCELTNRSPCSFAWLDLEADEDKLMSCPFCHGEVHIKGDIMPGAVKVWSVVCANCGYSSSWNRSKHDAMTAHNMFSKAVMNSKKEASNEKL